jgi:hypothetical protein
MYNNKGAISQTPRNTGSLPSNFQFHLRTPIKVYHNNLVEDPFRLGRNGLLVTNNSNYVRGFVFSVQTVNKAWFKKFF